MAKRNSRGAAKASHKKPHTKAAQSSHSRSKGLAGTFENASAAVTGVTNRIPASAFYWGLGALAMGAAAVGAYMYRDKIAEVYEETMESFNKEASDSDTDTAGLDSSRKAKSTSALTQTERH